jgi:hypothetical protein
MPPSSVLQTCLRGVAMRQLSNWPTRSRETSRLGTRPLHLALSLHHLRYVVDTVATVYAERLERAVAH